MESRSYTIRENGDQLTGTDGRWYIWLATAHRFIGHFTTQGAAMDWYRTLESR